MIITKFPRGDLKFREGTIEWLKRENIEEMNQKINILKSFYTTNIFQETTLILEKQLSFPIDKIVAKKSINTYK